MIVEVIEMKKNSLLKALLYVFLAYVVLSWVIKTGYVSSGTLSATSTEPVGLVDLIRYPIITFTSSLFVLSALVVLSIGGFYAVINKTGVYGNIIEGVTKRFKGKEFKFVIISTMVFGVLSSLTGLTLPLFILVPFFITAIMSLGYKKFTAFLATIGAILVGNMASTYGFNINGYIKYFLGVDMNTTIFYRICFLIVALGILIFAISKVAKVEFEKVKKMTKKSAKKDSNLDAKEEIVIPLYDGVSNKKKSAVPVIVISIILTLIALLSMYNWSNGLDIELFNNIYEAITSFEINGYPIFKNLIGSVDPIGYWSNYEFVFLIVVASLLIGWIYNLKIGEVVSSFIDGAKKMWKVALYMMLANVVFLMLNSSQTGANIYITIAHSIMNITDKFSVLTTGLTSVVGGIFYNDFPYMLNSLYAMLGTFTESLPLIGLIIQSLHGLMMLFVPTSVMLVIGLTYLDIPYIEYLKKIWKYLLMMVAAIVVLLVVAMIIL